MVFWAFSFIWYKDAYHYFEPLSLIFLRLIISSCLLVISAFMLKKVTRIKKNDIKYFILLALFEPFFYFLGESYGMKLVSSSLASVIISTIPLFTSVLAWLIYKERLSFFNIFGIFVSIIGILIVMFYKGFAASLSIRGIILMFVAVISAVCYSMVLKKVSGSYNPFMIVTLQNLIGAVFFLPLVFLFEKNQFLSINLTFEALVPLLKLAVFASSLAFIFFTYTIKYIGIARATVFTNSIPVLTSIFAYLLLNESFNLYKIAGIILVMGGLFMSQVKFQNIPE